MQVIDIKHIEDCFDNSQIMEVKLSEEITKEFIFSLGQNGDVQYFAHFARPFFKIRVTGIYDVKGIQGNKTMRVHLKNPREYPTDMFIKNVERFRENNQS